MKLSSMRARMTAIFALVVASLMIIGGILTVQRERRLAEDRVHEALHIAVLRAQSEVIEAKIFKERKLLDVVLEDQGEIAVGGLALFVVDDKGTLLWDSRAVPYPVDKKRWRCERLDWRKQSLILASDFSDDEKQLRGFTWTLACLSLFVIVTTSTAAWFLVGQTLSPIQKLASQAHASTDTLSVRLDAPSTDAEMQHLTATLNELLDRLQRDARARGRFYAAASHELRTPLQALLGHLDVALSRRRTAGDYEVALLEAQKHTERLTVLVQDLLQLNALEMRASVAARESLDLTGFVLDTLRIVEQSHSGRDLKIETHLAEVEVEASVVHLEMLLRNLIENAVKYAEDGTAVEVSVEESEDHAVFCVWNAYDGLDELSGEDLSTWFEPFFRLDASRNSQTGGNGLGLAICDSIARANNWTLSLESKNGGVLANVCFPLSPFPANSLTPAIFQQIP